MSQRMLNLSCIGRDALVRSQMVGEAWAMVTAYRVFETENGYGVAYQGVKLDVQTDQYERTVVPTRLADGFGTHTEAVTRMREYAQWEVELIKELSLNEGVEVLEAVVVSDEVQVW